jgi:NitT/TauT family transport system permease protein
MSDLGNFSREISGLLRPRTPLPAAIPWLASAVGFGILLMAWQIASGSYADVGRAVLFPAPSTVWNTAAHYAGFSDNAEQSLRDRQTLGTDLRASFVRVLLAFALATAVAVPLGVLSGSLPLFEKLLQPVSEFVRYIPIPALIPLLIVIFGIDETPKIMLIFLGTVFQLLLMVSDEIHRVAHDLVQACYTLGGRWDEAITQVLLPAAAPGIFDAMRLCQGWAWTWLIVAELVAANEGMGFRILRYQRFLMTDKIFVYLIVLGLLGLVMDLLFRLAHRLLFHWQSRV